MDLRPMGATGPTTSPDFLSPSSPSSAASPTSAASGATSPNSDRSTSPNQLGTSPKTDTSASATNLRLRKPLPEAAVANIDAKPAEVEKKTEPKEYRCVKDTRRMKILNSRWKWAILSSYWKNQHQIKSSGGMESIELGVQIMDRRDSFRQSV
ncbi:hypothetical protein BCR33DRAFT_445757 [Rhizoclosmatium globosum]|uniref:Uncharacterized protein n=1 Tax=Rhizoclosmatium globosum TaxID=329046 RepID=A0A1Y2BSP1_9FUNG|nr:hypothetical protein BCR33DRAFT_445757 [Rhizoclosmatium globosum]|eukprot:ORY37771.1 hypothetical protein BCR33DRAFT_445757 [Rhizoclosmatium globosum]